MRIATWNVNSVRQRLAPLLAFLRETSPDILCLQELKCEEGAFPRMEAEDAGYNVVLHGQKTFNGVAILSKSPIDESTVGLPGFDHEGQSRYIEAVISDGDGGALRVASVYCPNGNPPDTPKYAYKVRFMEALTARARALLKLEEATVLAGDYNIIPEPRDAHDPAAWASDALFLPQSRAAWRRLLNLGYTDALRAVTDDAGLYTFWDYQAGAWQKNKGIRIDHLLLSPQAADRLSRVEIVKEARAGDKPSDHVPVCAELV
ncbi:exodeoxyribonuclease III [Methylocystis sp. JAN1]|uniref:exodeoxyribonuclease III n=1 Tax=Methylocystis sp. JAN1 TaxID=3397211 RepID=UPI003FA2C3C5